MSKGVYLCFKSNRKLRQEAQADVATRVDQPAKTAEVVKDISQSNAN